MMVSRRREYLADASGAELTRNPLGLAQRAREDRGRRGADAGDQARHGASVHRRSARPADESKEGAWPNLFASHPPMAARIAALKAMAFGGARKRRGLPPAHVHGATMAIDRQGTGLTIVRVCLGRVLSVRGDQQASLAGSARESSRGSVHGLALGRPAGSMSATVPRSAFAIPGHLRCFARLVPLGELAAGISPDRGLLDAAGRRSRLSHGDEHPRGERRALQVRASDKWIRPAGGGTQRWRWRSAECAFR